MKLSFHCYGHSIEESDVAELEAQLGCSLPQDYRKFLLETNGGAQPDREIFSIENGDESFLKEIHSLKEGTSLELSHQIQSRRALGILPKEMIPIGLDGFGNDICLRVSGERRGEVYFHYHDRGKADPDDEFEPVYFVAHCFTDFLKSLRADPGKISHDEIELMGQRGGRADLINFISRGNSLEKTNKYNRTIAQEAARHGNLKLIQVCAEHGASLRGTIHIAALNGHAAVIDWLLSQGVDINERDKDGKTAFTRASFMHKDLAEALQKRGAIK